MTDFSFYNKAYDLLLQLKDENYIRPRSIKIESVADARLIMDLVDVGYPLYSTADVSTKVDFIKDLFKIEPNGNIIKMANRETTIWRPVQITDINPGITFKIVEDKYWYLMTFWTYADTNRIIPVEETDPRKYSDQFMFIWEKAKQGKAFVGNTFKHRLGDIVLHKGIKDSKGIIINRLNSSKPYPLTRPHYNIPNCYGIKWEDKLTKDDPRQYYWYDEDILINKTKLEASIMPMKIIKRKGKPREVEGKIFNQELYDNLTKFYSYTPEEIKEKEIGWVDGTIKYEPINRKPSDVRKKLRAKQKARRKAKHKANLAKSKPRKPKYIERIPHTSKEAEYIRFPNPNTHGLVATEPLVCVKHILTGLVMRVRKSKAEKLVLEKSDYDYANKVEWRAYLNTIKKNKDDAKPGPTKMGTQQILNPTTGKSDTISLNRKSRRANNKLRKGSRLVKEQYVTKIIPEKKKEIKSMVPTLIIYDENNNPSKEYFTKTIIIPARTIIKRILTRIQPHKEIKLTEEVKLQRAERSAIDKAKYLEKIGAPSLDTLKEQFHSEERRNDKYSTVEKWSKTFNDLTTLILKGKLFKNGEFKANVNKKGLRGVIDIVLKESHVNWSFEKIQDFIRYIRLTTHGVFGEKEKYKRPSNHKKLCKVKKPIQSVEFEVLKSITRLDYTKLKHNLPNPDKDLIVKFTDADGELEKEGIFKDGDIYTTTGDFLCALRDVISWKYKKDKDWQDLIIDEGGGISQVPIKFRRKDPEHLKIYFEREKKRKNEKRIRREAMQKVS